MRYNEYSKITNIIRDFNYMECQTYKTLHEAFSIDNNELLFETLYDLQNNINLIANKYINDKHIYSDIKRSTDDLTFIKKGIRNNDKSLIIESLNNLFNKLTTTRNSYNVQDENYKLCIENVKLEANEKLSEITNLLTFPDNIDIVTEANENNVNYLDKVKGIFEDKHKKIVARDNKFVKSLSSKKVATDVEIEVPDDNKVSFDMLIQRYDTFNRIFNTDNDEAIESKIKKYQDKNGDLKNGLDNYFRTGSAKRESGSRKMTGTQALDAVKNMCKYCDDYLKKGRKISDLISGLSQSAKNVKTESCLPELDFVYPIYEAEENNKTEEKNDDNKEKPLDIQHNKQIGITSLMTIAEQRYFDYINALRALFK